MREIRPSGSEGGVRFYASSLPYFRSFAGDVAPERSLETFGVTDYKDASPTGFRFWGTLYHIPAWTRSACVRWWLRASWQLLDF